MSLPTSDPGFLQRILRASGVYHDNITGRIDDNTRSAIAAFNVKCDAIAAQEGAFDSRTESNIRTLLPGAQVKARRFMKGIAGAHLSAGMILRIISGTRTYAEQQVLYQRHQQGGPQAVAPGHSNHNFGVAWDVGIFLDQGKTYIDDLVKARKMTQAAVDAEYKKAGAYGRALGLFWGGDWGKDADLPHYQVVDNHLLSQVRAKFENGGEIIPNPA